MPHLFCIRDHQQPQILIQGNNTIHHTQQNSSK